MWSKRRGPNMCLYSMSNLRRSVGKVVGLKGGETAPKKDGRWKIT